MTVALLPSPVARPPLGGALARSPGCLLAEQHTGASLCLPARRLMSLTAPGSVTSQQP